MNRPIKFRAWDGTKIIIDPKIGFVEGKYDYSLNDEFADPEDKRIYMQYTGLKDKNDKEIYEGDVVIRSVSKKQYEFEVTWCDGGFKFLERKSMLNMEYGDFWFSEALAPLCHCGETLWDFEVIGNIYENPELC